MGINDNQESDPARLCLGGCGFYGSEKNRGLCSHCYADHLKDIMLNLAALNICKDQVSVVPSDDHPKPSVVVKKGRCRWCNKKVGLLGFNCRCGATFCGAHRHPEDHACSGGGGGIDFKEAGKVRIRMENPVVKTDKLVDRI